MHRFVNVSGICKGNRAVLLFNFHLKEIPPSSSLSVMQSSRLKKKNLINHLGDRKVTIVRIMLLDGGQTR